MGKLDFKDKWIVVTGASSGLGMAMARRLAAIERANLVIAARRKDRLEQLKKEIEESCPVKVECVDVDLSRPDGGDFLFEQAVKIADVAAVINNAGLTSYGKTHFDRWEKYEQIVAVDFVSLMKLSLKFLAYFQERGGGAILNVTSLGSFITMPYQNVYSACKHAAQSFTFGLNREYKNSGIHICSFAPGGIATEMITKSGLDKKLKLDNPFNMDANLTAKIAIQAFKKKKALAVPGIANRLSLLLLRFAPRQLVLWASEKIYRPPDNS